MLTAKIIKGALAAALLIGLPGAGMAIAQDAESLQQPAPTEVSEGQLDSFANAYRAVQEIRQAAEPEMVAAVEASGLTVEEFMAIAQTQTSPEAAPTEIPTEQAEQFEAAAQGVIAIQEEARGEMTAAIQEEGLTVEEFEAIIAMAQEDPQLQEQIAERLSQ